MDRVLLERTVALVRSGAMTQGEATALSKALRVAVDSRPLLGAGRVEDTINLLGHAARTIVRIVSKLTDREPEDICRKAGIPLLLAPSIKAGLDLNWSDARQKAAAIEVVERQVSSLPRWVEHHLDEAMTKPLQSYIEALTVVREQDLETTEHGKIRIRDGVAADRRISVEGLELPIIVACSITPANRPEEEGAAPIRDDIARQGFSIAELHIDRGYVNSPVVADVLRAQGRVLAKPWTIPPMKTGMFTKRDFKIDLRAKTVRS